MTTYTGKFVDPMNMRPEDICLPDIAHALAMKCRFGGHCREFYSIAQHCCLAATHIQPICQHDRALALLHDASEAYLFDIPTPLKERGDQLFELEVSTELVLLDTIIEKYLPNVKRGTWEGIDHQLLITECRTFMNNWEHIPVANEIPSVHISITPWSWQRAEQTFLMLAGLLGMND